MDSADSEEIIDGDDPPFNREEVIDGSGSRLLANQAEDMMKILRQPPHFSPNVVCRVIDDEEVEIYRRSGL